MSVEYCRLKYASRKAEYGPNGDQKRTAVYVVKSTSATESVATVMAAPGVSIGDGWNISSESAPDCLCENIKPELSDESNKVWYVTLSYSTKATDGDEGDQSNPTNRPERVRWGKGTMQRALLKDRTQPNAKAIVNSAGGRFAKTLMGDISYMTLTFTRNELSYPVGTALGYFEAINTDVFQTAPVGTVLCKGISADWQWEQFRISGVVYHGYWQTTYEFWFNPEERTFDGASLLGWDEEILDEGSYYQENVSGTYKKVIPKDKDGLLIAGPIPLDGAGGKLSDAAIRAGQFKFLRFRTHYAKPFSALNIPALV